MASHNASNSWKCYYSSVGLYIIPSFTLLWTLLLFTLCLLVLHTSLRRRRQNKRYTVSHADVFTYNAFCFEAVRWCGYVVYSLGSLHYDDDLIKWGLFVRSMLFPGLLSLHMLVCVERYVAVIFPVVYLNLRKRRWVWLRNAMIVVVWALCVVWAVLLYVLKQRHLFIPMLTSLAAEAAVVAFCSAHILHSLRKPGPGERSGGSQSKRRAVKTILVILLALMLWLVEGFTRLVLVKSKVMKPEVACQLQKASCWFELPSSLVIPLLFLQRAGKLNMCRGWFQRFLNGRD